MMIVYQANPDGWFAGITEADESPLEPGVFHLPAGAYEDPPPPRETWQDGEWPRRTTTGWVMQVPRVATMTPAQKLAAFLASNPDVVDLIAAAM